jgi:hypothetical protein
MNHASNVGIMLNELQVDDTGVKGAVCGSMSPNLARIGLGFVNPILASRLQGSITGFFQR